MTREIRFRAWSKEDKKIIHFGIFPILEKKYAYGVQLGDMPIMQFTGLKDSKGREIWEGDICKAGDVVGTIDFHNGRFCWTDGACHWDMVFNNAVDHCPIESKIERCGGLSVIGNVWENPEMLKGER